LKVNPILISTLCTLLFAGSFFIQNCFGQHVEGVVYLSYEDEELKSLVPYSNGSFILFGQSRMNDYESEDFRIWNITEDGQLIWYGSYGNIHQDHAGKMIACKNGDFVFIGSSQDGVFGRQDISVTRFNANMIRLWTKFYGTDHRDEGISIAEFSNGDLLLAGVSKNSLSSPNQGLFTLYRISSNGQLLWEKKWGHSSSRDILYDLVIDQNDNIYTVGAYRARNGYSSFEFNIGNSLPYLCKLSGQGQILWDTTYSYPGNNELKTVRLDAANNLIVGGDYQAFSNNFDCYLAHINSTGQILWETNFGGASFDKIGGVEIVENTIYVSSTTCEDTLNYSTQGRMSKFDLAGNQLWSKTYGGNKSDYLSGLHYFNQKFYAIGKSNSFGSGNFEAYLLITDSTGNVLNEGKASQASEASIYPNPANDFVNIIIPEGINCDSIEFNFYHSNGKLIFQENIQYLNRYAIELSSFPPGLYLYSIKGSCIEPKQAKLIIAR
jgi:hypothetical protein